MSQPVKSFIINRPRVAALIALATAGVLVVGGLAAAGINPLNALNPAKSATYPVPAGTRVAQEIAAASPGYTGLTVTEARDNPNYLKWHSAAGQFCTAMTSAVSVRGQIPGDAAAAPYCRPDVTATDNGGLNFWAALDRFGTSSYGIPASTRLGQEIEAATPGAADMQFNEAKGNPNYAGWTLPGNQFCTSIVGAAWRGWLPSDLITKPYCRSDVNGGSGGFDLFAAFNPAGSASYGVPGDSRLGLEIGAASPGATNADVVEVTGNPNYAIWDQPDGTTCDALVSAVSQRGQIPGDLITAPYCHAGRGGSGGGFNLGSAFNPSGSATYTVPADSKLYTEIQAASPGSTGPTVTEAHDNPNVAEWQAANGDRCVALASGVSFRGQIPGDLAAPAFCVHL